jgi:hypothetical protein
LCNADIIAAMLARPLVPLAESDPVAAAVVLARSGMALVEP